MNLGMFVGSEESSESLIVGGNLGMFVWECVCLLGMSLFQLKVLKHL